MQVVVGGASSFGERSGCGFLVLADACSVVLGYMRMFPPKLVNSWASGTGLAGVGGSALYLLYSALGLSIEFVTPIDLRLSQLRRVSFLATLPWVLVYLAAFFLMLDRTSAVNKDDADKHVQRPADERSHLIGVSPL